MADETKPHLKDFLIYIGIVVVGIAGAAFLFSSNNSAKTENVTNPAASPSATMNTGKYSTPPKMSIDSKKTYTATFTTDKGAIVVKLYADETPSAVNNFVFLAREKFYDGTVFHRTIKDFMIQGGDPNGDGTGGPGYSFDDEKVTRDYKRGTLAMANRGPNTNGSQFFIMHKDYALPKQYVIFGEVTKGIDVVDAIATAPVEKGASGEESTPVTPVKVIKVTIEEK
jgi:cyclophilin family peptidyl-prolyl cis-trans isomerase